MQTAQSKVQKKELIVLKLGVVMMMKPMMMTMTMTAALATLMLPNVISTGEDVTRRE